MKNQRPLRKHRPTRNPDTMIRLIMKALQAPVPPRLKTWARI